MQVVIIGGGAAGFFAAIRCAELYPELQVTLLEQGPQVLGKVKVSGGGRCNVTHACFDVRSLCNYYPRGGQALLGPFHKFMPADTVEWFEGRGVRLKTEADGRMFPVTDSSQSVIDCLTGAAQRAGVQVHTRRQLQHLKPLAAGQWEIGLADGSTLSAARVLIASGSSQSVWAMLAKLGHRIEPPAPSLFTFNIRSPLLEGLSGLSVPDAQVWVPGSSLTARGPVLITHWGLSGPGILRISAWGARVLQEKNYHFPLGINWLAGQFGNAEAARGALESLRAAQARRQMGSHAAFGLPQRLWERLLAAAGLPESQRWADLSRRQAESLAQQLCNCALEVQGKSTWKDEFVTCGGVSLDEVDFRRMESRILPGLFFAGEVLDIDALTGGFNFQAAWTSAWIAAEAMGKAQPATLKNSQ